jgi:hypothetical protein
MDVKYKVISSGDECQECSRTVHLLNYTVLGETEETGIASPPFYCHPFLLPWHPNILFPGTLFLLLITPVFGPSQNLMRS